MFYYNCIVINVLFLHIHTSISFSLQVRRVMQARQNHNQVRQCIIILYCNSGLGSSKGSGDKDAESDTESVESGSSSEGQDSEEQESAEELSSKGQVEVGGSEATGEAGSHWETENIIYDTMNVENIEKMYFELQEEKANIFYIK